MFVRTEDGTLKDVEIGSITKDNYIVPEGERDCYHVIMENKQFNPKTGDKISRPRLQKFKAVTFKKLRSNFERQGYTLEIVYDPTAYIAEVGDNARKIRANAEQQRINEAVRIALAEQEKTIQARIDKAVAQALAESKKTTRKEKNE